MISLNSINYYSKINNELEKLDNSINFIIENSLTNEKQSIVKNIVKSNLATNGAEFHYIVRRVNSEKEMLISSFNNKFKIFKSNFNILNFFGALNEIKNNIGNICNEFNYTDDNISTLLNHLYELANSYQKVIQNEEKDDIVDFFYDGEKVCAEFYSIRRGLKSYIDSLGNEKYDPKYDNVKCLELQLLDSQFNLGEFGNILVLLNDSYNALKTLSESEEYKNLEIIKIESGSLLSKIFGDENVIELLSLIIHKVAKEMYQKFTQNGQIQKQKEIMDMISSSADVIEKIENLGVNTGKSKSDLKDCLNITTNNIYKILSKSGKIKINDELICIGDNQKLVEYKTLYLENTASEECSGDDND